MLLFAQNDPLMQIEFPAAAVGVEEKEILGSYSASVDDQDESARLVFERRLPVKELISHRFSLEQIADALDLAARPAGDTLKVVIVTFMSTLDLTRNGHMTAAVLYGREDLKVETHRYSAAGFE